ncbi:hypothetical protein [Legionella maioricensis]|uniref:Uncharacterized protein n=1 Tax=Legionella maioricensis TaxID=2896528 RepID=A0A9X2CYQ8_9GAMM|nr:hypothetical protein [Legionella maioricensis]MCL9683350.1 hypothetical protein [Legionella maioricensis]MCL9685954.1 hypothetical protein [Legionella maioricensis]
MFSFLKSKKNREVSTPPLDLSVKKNKEGSLDISDSPSPAQEIKPAEGPKDKDTWVFIWSMTADNVGHVAVQIGGAQPKMKEEDPGEYASIHPDKIPSMGLTSVLPLPAHIATNLSEDMENLGGEKNTVFIDMDGPRNVKPHKDSGPLQPDRVYHFKNLDTPAMREHIHKTHEKVKTGEVSYQLFPNVNLIKFFKDSSAFIAQDPVDIEMHRKISEKKESTEQAYNCTTLVSDILNKGGLPIKHSKTKPWGITPNGLADEIERKGPGI